MDLGCPLRRCVTGVRTLWREAQEAGNAGSQISFIAVSGKPLERCELGGQMEAQPLSDWALTQGGEMLLYYTKTLYFTKLCHNSCFPWKIRVETTDFLGVMEVSKI